MRPLPMKIYAFDVDLTLECSMGPVTMASVKALRDEGNIVGLCGNWARVTLSYPADWWRTFSFVGPLGLSKSDFLQQLRCFVLADEYVMVGNDVQVGSSPNDAEAARIACCRFIKESDFAAGAR